MSAYQPLLLGSTISTGGLRVESKAARLLHGMLGYLSSGSLTCRHRQMSRPFTNDGETYCVCLRCGMQRAFDLDDWKLKGPFYNDSRRTVQSMAVNKQFGFHEASARRSHATHDKSRAVPALAAKHESLCNGYDKLKVARLWKNSSRRMRVMSRSSSRRLRRS